MKVKELIETLKVLEQEKEIRYDSHEFPEGFPIVTIEKTEYKGNEFYCID